MKHLLTLISISVLLFSCNEKIPQPVQPVPDETTAELELNMSTASMTKGIITSTRLPNLSYVGLFVRDDSGEYSGDAFTNIKYRSYDSNGLQLWYSDTPIILSDTEGEVYSYYPYKDAATDYTAVPVTATSAHQDDWMYGTVAYVSKSARTAVIRMQHALAVVRVRLTRGTYTGEGKVTFVSFKGDCAATRAKMDCRDGSLSGFTGMGFDIMPAIGTFTLSPEGKNTDIIVVPTGGKVGTTTVTIDGKKYPITLEDLTLEQGKITTLLLTVNNGELSLSDITVSSWTYAETEQTQIKVSNNITIAGSLDDIAFYNNVTNGTVTITAVPKVPQVNKEVLAPSLSGKATMTQSSDINTGIRTITLTGVDGNVTLNFPGTVVYDLVAEYDVKAGESTQFLYKYGSTSYLEPIESIMLGDEPFEKSLTYTFSETGKKTFKFQFKDHIVPYDMFNRVTALTGARISANVTTIKGFAFAYSSLEEFYIPETATTIAESIFYECSKLRKVRLAKYMTSIPNNLFSGCRSLEHIDMHEGITSIGSSAFKGCKSLISVTIPSTVTTIGNYAFADCDNLRHIASLPVITPTCTGTTRYHFSGIAIGGVLAVPAAAKTGSNYSYWVADNVHLGIYGWTLVYMDE